MKICYNFLVISESLGRNPSQSNTNFIPGQRTSEQRPEVWVTDEIIEAAGRLASYEMVVIENGPVFALAANASDPNILTRIRTIKSEKRGHSQPIGLITPFDGRLAGYLQAIDAIDVDAITEPTLQELVSDPALLTSRLGALAFVRAPAEPTIKVVTQLPDAIVPPHSGSTVQLFSPVGNLRAEAFSRAAADQNVMLTMTSANISGQPEIVTLAEARAFAHAGPGDLQVLHQYPDGAKPQRPRGSYPVLEIMTDHIRVVRPGFLEYELIAALFSDYDIRLPADYKKTNYPDNVLRRQDLPKDDRDLQQVDLRAAILETIN